MCAVASLRFARARPLPTLPHMHLLRPGLLLAPLISILTVAGEWAALLGTPRTPARAANRESGPFAEGDAEGGWWQSHPALGASCLYSFFSFFSLPPPGFKGTAPAEATGQAAAVSPVSRRPLRPGWTGSHRSARPKLQGVFRLTPGPKQPGCRVWLSRLVHDFCRVRLGWEIKLLDNYFPTPKQREVRSFSIAPGISSSVPRRLADTSECRLAAPQSAQIPVSKPVLQDAWVRPPSKPSWAEAPSSRVPCFPQNSNSEGFLKQPRGVSCEVLAPPPPARSRPRGYQHVVCKCGPAFLNRLLDRTV